MLKKIIFATVALGISSAALAHDDGRDRGQRRGWGGGHERWERHYRPHYYQPRAYVVPAPRVVYAPPPRVVYPYAAPPMVYVQPAPVITYHYNTSPSYYYSGHARYFYRH